jgi:hypothetical protein
MKYIIEFAVLFSIVIIYYLQLANKQDTTLGNLVYIPLIILCVKYPMAAFIGLVCVILYNQQTIEGFDGSRLPSTSTTGANNQSTDDLTSTTTTSGTTTSNDTSSLTQLTSATSAPSSNVNASLQQQHTQQRQQQEKQLVGNLVNKIKQLRASNRIKEVNDIISNCKANSGTVGFNEALIQCGITDSSGNLLPPFSDASNTINTENNSITNANPASMLPLTQSDSSDVVSQGGVNQVDTSQDLRQGLSDRSGTSINRSNMTLSEPQGSSTTESFSNIF